MEDENEEENVEEENVEEGERYGRRATPGITNVRGSVLSPGKRTSNARDVRNREIIRCKGQATHRNYTIDGIHHRRRRSEAPALKAFQEGKTLGLLRKMMMLKLLVLKLMVLMLKMMAWRGSYFGRKCCVDVELVRGGSGSLKVNYRIIY